MKKEKAVCLSKGLGRYLTIPVLSLWLFSMVLLTWAVGRDLYIQLEKGVAAWQSQAEWASGSIKHNVPGATENYMYWQIVYGHHFLDPEPLLSIVLPQNKGSLSSDDAGWENWELYCGYQAAMGYYDANGEKLLASGDFLFFPYRRDPDATKSVGYTYINLDALPGGKAFADQYISPSPFGDFMPFSLLQGALQRSPLEFTGRFKGNQFIPAEISLSGQILYASEAEIGEMETIYATELRGCNYHAGKPFYLNGTKYENAAALLNTDEESRFGMLNAVIIARTGFFDGGTLQIAVRCSPLAYAARRLWPVYLITFLLTVLCVYLLWRRVYSTLIYPLTSMADDLVVDRITSLFFPDSPYAELQELRDSIHTVQKDRQQAKNQVQQLQTALNYAKNAEASRRKMLSAMAHELKTPLAVLQSYAEGLQTGIAADKQEKYLSVIREETAHMDAMVLEMLEFSRLEAGKVLLNLQPLSLPDLTQRIFEKLDAAAQKKKLSISFDMPTELSVHADEARIVQVITNFASNAVKYTPDGGQYPRLSLPDR